MFSKPLFCAAAAAAAATLLSCPATAVEEGSYETGPVVVTATRTPHPEAEVSGSVTVLDREDIGAAASPDLRTILDLAPSITVNDSGLPAGVATASIRGSLSTQVLVLLDGVRLADAQSSFFNLNDLPVPMERVERIEILPIPASALYGADAMGGVINVITRPPAEEAEARLSVGAGSFEELRGAAGVQWGGKGASLRADGVLRSGDGHRENGDYRLENATAGLRWKASSLTFDFSAAYLNREGGSPGHEDFPTPDARQEDEKSYFRLGGSWGPGGAWEFAAAVFYDRQRRSYRDPAFGEESRHRNRKGGIDAQWNLDTGPWGLWSLGGEWISDEVESTDDGDHDTSRWALFVQDEVGVGPWRAVATLRLDEHSVYGSEVDPRISLLRTFAGRWRAWASVSRGYRAPNFDDLYWTGGYGAGNPELKPETSWNYEAGVEKSWQERGRIRATAFRRDVEDLIQWTDQDGDFVFSPENVASARIWGVEAESEYRPLRWLSLPVSYQYVDGEDGETGEELPGQVRHLAKASLRCRWGAWRAALEGSYTDRNSTIRTKDWDYAVAAVTAGWSGEVGRFPLDASLRLDNVFDEDYEKVEGFPMAGRSVYGEVGILF